MITIIDLICFFLMVRGMFAIISDVNNVFYKTLGKEDSHGNEEKDF